MPALNYQKRFAPMVESGEKVQTIRALRKHPIKKGDTLYHYTGMRTKACRRLLDPTPCLEVLPFTITPVGEWEVNCYLNDALIPSWEIEDLALADGFVSASDFVNWFKTTHGLPFYGQIIYW